ncbi:hypothetical protein RP29_00355 [Acidovorax temperans]|uniref:NACHT domain-containing protein n=1 Tax=Acidovorax temperans TaxID=80878 RepID=A0A0D7KDU8_9BURK|nr:hypothetical protein [Acidovorax temperans]KJA12355.1 hypothetical protein RP29_00355 [Acidovorax temperans]
MAFFEGFGTQLGKVIGGLSAAPLLDRARRKLAARKAAREGAGAEVFLLESLIRKELQELAKYSGRPANLSNDGFRDWVLSFDQERRFATTLLARARGAEDAQAVSELANKWAMVTGEAPQAAEGAVNYVLSHLLKVIRSTDSGRRALDSALHLRAAGHLEALSGGNQQQPSEGDVLNPVRAMARQLLQAAARNWGMPPRVVTLSLDRRFGRDLADREPVDFDKVAELIAAHRNIVIFGDGGLGKTTLLLHVCSQLVEQGSRVPLFLDASAWARSGKGMLEYVAAREQALASQVSASHLARLAAGGQLALFINGWNEIAGEHRERCRSELVDLEATYKELALVVTTRSWQEFPRPNEVQHLQVLGLTWKEQVAAIRSALPLDASKTLLEVLAKHSGLRWDSRSPLILRGVLDMAATEDVASASTLDFISAAVASFERSPQHASVLAAKPLDGRARAYLQAVAFELTRTLRLEFPRDDALRALAPVALKLQSDGLLLAPPHLPDVLSALVEHHVLQEDEGAIRFAHHRFQEFFAAQQVLAVCTPDEQLRDALKIALHNAGWDEVLQLVAQNLRRESARAQRVVLVAEALIVDLGLACDLAGESGFGRADDAELYESCVRMLKELSSSPVEEVRGLATCFQIASRWPVFADELWPLLESDDQQVRVTTYRLSQNGISLRQLGPQAPERITAWPEDRQSEFIHEVAENSDNVPYLEDVAQSSNVTLRKAAISALLWNYPASEAGLRFWAEAPDNIRVELLGDVSEILERVPEPEDVQQALAQLANTLEDKQQVQFVREFPSRATAKAVPGLIAHLRAADGRGHDDTQLLSVAMKLAPVELLELITQLATSRARLPQWVWRALEGQPADALVELRKTLIARLIGDEWANTDASLVGAIATCDSTGLVLDAWQFAEAESRTSTATTKHDKRRHLQDALLATPGSVLMKAVSTRVRMATYAEATELVELLLWRVQREPSPMRQHVESWNPEVDELRLLLSAIEGLTKPDDAQDALRAYLASLCSKTHATQFESFLFEVFEHHLELWSAHARTMEGWNHQQPRPTNPYLGQYVRNAAAALGFAAIPKLLSLATHPQAKHLVPETLVQIVTAPWHEDSVKGIFTDSVSNAVIEGHRRAQLGRVSLQPTDATQAVTDQVAEYFSRELKEQIVQAAVNTDRGDARYALGEWAKLASKVPSRVVVPALLEALGCGLVTRYPTVDIAKGLLRRGEQIAAPQVVRHIETLLELDPTKWEHDVERHSLGELAALLVCAVPDELLSKSWTHWHDVWLKHSHEHSVIDACRSGGCLRAWDILEQRLTATSMDSRERTAEAMLLSVDAQSFPRLLGHVRSGALFAHGGGLWRLQQLTSKLILLMRGNPDGAAAFIEACRACPAPEADAYLVHVLESLGVSRETQGGYLLESLDAGRIASVSSPGMSAMRSIFASRHELGQSMYEVLPAACNGLRRGLYQRAKQGGSTAQLARIFLAELEADRREGGRPDEEPRHPDASDGREWTRALAAS